jgi:hypothetical protein
MSGLGEIECKRGLDKILHRELNGRKIPRCFVMFDRDREAKCCDTYESGKAEIIRGYSIAL